MRSEKYGSTESGFSLLEVLVATGLLAVAALGVAQLFAFAADANLNSRGQTSTAVLATQKMEQLRSLAWGYAEGEGVLVGTTLTDTTTDLTVDPPVTGGAGKGLTASPSDSLDVTAAGFVDYLDAAGNWVGTGLTPPANTLYIRRWSIQPLPTNPNNTLVLQVRVITLRRELERQAAGAIGVGRLRDETRLVSVKTRKAS
jgi:prepilin-type N-terminal cleavage/methylation domain-containing protein